MATGNNTLTKIFQRFIPDNIPKQQTNVFWSLFNGVDAVFAQFEVLLKFFRKERNILTANQISSLRSLAAYNGFEPELLIAATGIASMVATPKLFSRVGFPLYLPPYAEFTEQNSGLTYYFDSNKVLRIDNSAALIVLTEGSVVSTTQVSTGQKVERFYLPAANITDGSVTIAVDSVPYRLVKSFADNANVNDGKLFLIKYSNRADMPVIVYVMGTALNDVVTIGYRTCAGEGGNLVPGAIFTTNDLLTTQGLEVNASSDELQISVVSGFVFGSNGTDENSLRSAIGFNHGVTLLFDTVSYTAFINKYSTILLQKVVPNPNQRQISNIYVSVKTYIDPTTTVPVSEQYQEIIGLKSFLMPADQKALLDGYLSDNEFALSSHNLFDPDMNHFAFQFIFDTEDQRLTNMSNLKEAVYGEFAKFLWDRSYQSNFELVLSDFMKANSTNFTWSVFSQSDEATKLAIKTDGPDTPYIITGANGVLPILRGDFPVSDQNYNPVQLFFDLNIISKETLN